MNEIKIDPTLIEDLMEKKGLHLALGWFEKLPFEKQIKIFKTFTKVFESNRAPTIKDLERVQQFYGADSIGRAAMTTDIKNSKSKQASFDKLAPFFPTPKQWNDYWKYKSKYSNHFDLQALEQVIKDLPFFNKTYHDPEPEMQYARQADALLELHPFRKDLLKLSVRFKNRTKLFLKNNLKKGEIIQKAHDLKNTGMSVEYMFFEMKNWLITDLGFSNDELQHRFGFRFHEHEEAHHTFNKFVNKNRFKHN